MRKLIAGLLLCWSIAAQAQVIDDNAVFAPSVTYVGPGDVVTFTAWGSCARVYTAAQASTSTSLCDLVDSSAPTTVICTLRGSSTGFVDLSGSYCTGSLTPAAKCAAATGGVCNVQKVYDQTGGGDHYSSNTAANQPTLSFSALGGLPCMAGTTGGPTVLAGTNNHTESVPYGFSVVSKSSAGGGIYYAATPTIGLARSGSNTILMSGTTSVSASDASFHGINAVSTSGANSAIRVDNTDNTGLSSGGGVNSGVMRLFRTAGGSSMTGTICEFGYKGSNFDATQRSNINDNQHGTSGYNF